MQNDKSLMFHDVPPIRLALIGAGLFAQHAIIPALLTMPEHFEIGAIYSRSEATAKTAAALLPHEVAIYTELEPLLQRDDIPALGIQLPIHVMPDVIRQALSAGKHVMSEKPIAPTLEEGVDLLKFAAQFPAQVWMVAENYRFASAIRKARESIGQLGKLAAFNWAIFAGMTPQNMYYQTPWRRDNSHQGGFLLDGGIHFMAALREILGEVAEVNAHILSIRPDLPPVDTMAAVVKMESGLHGALSVSYAVGVPWTTSLTIVGEHGAIEVNRDNFKLTLGEQVETFQGESGVKAEWEVFAEVVRGQANPLSLPRHALGDLAFAEALFQSSKAGGETIQVKKME